MKRGICLFFGILISVCLLSGCGKLDALFGLNLNKSITVDGKNEPRRYAKDYLNLTKGEIEAALGRKTQEEYYGGALIYRFEKANMWFWFGGSDQSFDEIPQDAQCVYVTCVLRDAADFDADTISQSTLSSALGFYFDEPEFDEHDGVFKYFSEKDGIHCSVSCAENGTASVYDDVVVYKIIED